MVYIRAPLSDHTRLPEDASRTVPFSGCLVLVTDDARRHWTFPSSSLLSTPTVDSRLVRRGSPDTLPRWLNERQWQREVEHWFSVSMELRSSMTRRCGFGHLYGLGWTQSLHSQNTNVVKFFSLLRKNDIDRQLVYYQVGSLQLFIISPDDFGV
jgi:hypothetical protein